MCENSSGTVRTASGSKFAKGWTQLAKKITRIVLTGGPAAGKTTLISRILKEFKQDDGWKVITVPETATDLITGFGIKPFGNCISMYDFQYFVIEDQLHKDRLALKAAQMVPEENVLIIYDRALLDDKAYITDEEFREVLASFGRTEEEVMGYYDAVLHLVSCAKGAEFAYNFGNEARYEPLEVAREKDDLTLRAWSKHPNLRVIDNSVNFEDKIARGLRAIYETIGEPVPEEVWHKYLIELPDVAKLVERYRAAGIDMMQTYLSQTSPSIVRRIRQQKNGDEYLYFYTEKHYTGDGTWETERPISGKEYIQYLMEGDISLHAVHKMKYRFNYEGHRFEIDVYPFSDERAIMRAAMPKDKDEIAIPPEVKILREVTNDPAYRNSQLAKMQRL